MKTMYNLKVIENRIGYIFKNKLILQAAFTHKSCNKDVNSNYERLEFIGDSVIGLAASHYLYIMNENVSEGKLSKMKDSLVSLCACTKYADFLGLDEHMVHCKGMKERAKYFKGDLFESLVGAIYIDGGFDLAFNFFKDVLKNVIKIYGNLDSVSYIALLQEYSHKHYKDIPDYSVISEEGPDHEKVFSFAVRIHNNSKGFGIGKCKKEAKENAAKDLLSKLGIKNYDDESTNYCG